MRPEFDSEIDSVLRGHARRGGARPAAWDAVSRPSIPNGAQSGPHLDADEIAAFGEDALPAAARSRYSAHLADCDDCRRSVAQVAMAAGVADSINERAGAAATAGVVEGAGERGLVAAAAYATRSPSTSTQSSSTQSPSSATQPPSWRERLSAIFAPRAWRYAMPVVALVAVSAVVLVVTRRVPREGLLDQAANRSAAPQTASAPAAPDSHHAGAPPPQEQAQPATQAGNANTADLRLSTEAGADTNAAGEVAKVRPKTVDGLDQSATIGTAGPASARPEVAQKAQAQTAPATTEGYAIPPGTQLPPPPAAAPAPAPVLRDVAAQPTPSALPPREYAEARAPERSRDDSRGAGALSRDEAPATKRHGPQRAMGGVRSAELSSAADAPKDDRAASRRARGPAKNESNRNEPVEEAKARRADEDRDKRAGEDREQQAETRSVGGRRFRREGGVWIDTAYRSGQATVVVRRGSEQYRALVADAPEIDRISRDLGGEAVIIWKGRAYRVKP